MNTLFKEIDTLQQEINALRPLNEFERNQLKEYFRVRLTYSSNALEGNSLTETETKIVLEEGITIGGKRLVDHLEAVGHSDAYTFLYECARNKSFSESDICRFHHLFYVRINEEQAGVYRKVKVYISGSEYTFPDPDYVPRQMNELIPKLNLLREETHPVEFAALAHTYFVFIHPFIDGNGRVARLLMNLALVQAGYSIAIIPPVMRRDYIAALEKAHTNDRDFVSLIATMVRETQKDMLRLLR